MTSDRSGHVQRTGVRWLKFNAGGIGILVQSGTLAALTTWLHVGYITATALAVEVAIIQNFFWHERFTWADRGGLRTREDYWRFLKFNVTTGAFSILGNVALMRVFVGLLHLNLVLANLLTIATCSIFNFAVSDRLVFKKNKNENACPFLETVR
jgi:dolichol-phosphate mannosyltransferase